MDEKEIITYTDDFENSLDSNLDARVSFFLKSASNAWESIISRAVTDDIDWNASYHNALRRYKAYADELSDTIKRKNDLCNNQSFNEDMRFRYAMISMILAGSLLEATIQIFLLTYLEDYKRDSKYHWVIGDKDVDISKVRQILNDSLTSMVDGNILTSKQKKSINKVIKARLSLHEDWDNITKFTLEDLISFCKDNIFTRQNIENESEETADCATERNHGRIEVTANKNDPFLVLLNECIDAMFNQIADGTRELSDYQIISAMTSIQKARNNIHIFTQEKAITVEETDGYIKVLCLIIHELGTRIYHKDIDARKVLNS